MIYNCFAAVRFLQFVTGIVVLALYVQDIEGKTDVATTLVSQLYSVIVGGVSALSALVFMFPFIAKPGTIWWMDMAILVNYGIVLAIWGGKYLGQPEPGLGNTLDKDVRLHHACYVDAAGLMLWAATGIYAAVKFYRERKGLSRKSKDMAPAFDDDEVGGGYESDDGE